MPFYVQKRHILLMRHHKRAGPLRAGHKRVSLVLSRPLQASMTVEAALVLPLYLFFLCNILYLFEALRLQSRMDCALHETGMKICGYAYFAAAAIGGEEEGAAPDASSQAGGGTLGILTGTGSGAALGMLSEGYVRSSCTDFLGEDYLSHSCLEGGPAAISYARSEILTGEDRVVLAADYRIRPFIPILAPPVLTVGNRFCGRAFTGWDVSRADTEEGDVDETIVYITPTGEVYHRDRNCTYLKPSVQCIPADALADIRNSGGARYYPCEVCHPSRSGMLIITSDGNRYHSSSSCPAVKRTVLEVPLSSVERTRRPCSKCGGG